MLCLILLSIVMYCNCVVTLLQYETICLYVVQCCLTLYVLYILYHSYKMMTIWLQSHTKWFHVGYNIVISCGAGCCPGLRRLAWCLLCFATACVAIAAGYAALLCDPSQISWMCFNFRKHAASRGHTRARAPPAPPAARARAASSASRGGGRCCRCVATEGTPYWGWPWRMVVESNKNCRWSHRWSWGRCQLRQSYKPTITADWAESIY